ncbi:MAG: PBP1A family penicillin-binding protein [Candidatus Chisholmbacteria bacterium]|nr:PBP1A family penicillin-binding protein [Candidatus Chisholmbacteria bacterium]
MSWLNVWRNRRRRQLVRGDFRRRQKAKLWRAVAILGLVGVVGFLLVSVILFAWYSRDLPGPDGVIRREGFATRIFDREGELLYDIFGDQNRNPVALEQIPEDLRQATIAIEDKDFYKHEGFDPAGMTRGILRLFTRGRAQGGSTLTQQLVKNVLLTSERSLGRKIKEFILAVQIERRFTKDEILQMYLNEAPYGGTAWGVGTAAEVYFKKEVGELTLVESAILAGMPQLPTAYSPYGPNPKAYIGRTEAVLRRMREDGYITAEEEKAAAELLADVEFAPASQGINAPHFVFYVREQLDEMFGERLVEQGGLRVTTSLNFDLQREAQEIVASEIEKVEDLDITNGAALVMDTQTGEILAMVGSKDYFAEDYDGQVNVVLSRRQPGSAIKPVTYVTAFRKGLTPATEIADVRTEFPSGDPNDPYAPTNYDGEFRGPVQLRYALGSSLNLPAVKVLALVGVQDMLEVAYDLGFTTLEPTNENVRRFGLSVTLGGGEVRLLDMVTAYSAFSNGGETVKPVAILKVEDRNGKVLFEHRQAKGKRVLSEEEAFLINHILSDNNARLLTFGANSLINIAGRSIAVKTGTTNDQRDNWTVGWTRDTAVGVWVGNNDNSQMREVASGVTGAAPIWRRIFLEVLSDRPDEAFSAPAGVEARLVDSISGYPEHDGFPSRSEYFIQGTVPTGDDPIHAKLKVCKSSGKLATPLDMAKGDSEEKEFIVLKEDDPLTGGGQNMWQKGIDEWLATVDDSRYHPPTEPCSQNDDLVVSMTEPSNEERINDNDVTVKVTAVANSEIEWVRILVDGSVEEELTKSPYNTTLTLDDGAYTLKARVRLKNGEERESNGVKIGVNQDWDE